MLSMVFARGSLDTASNGTAHDPQSAFRAMLLASSESCGQELASLASSCLPVGLRIKRFRIRRSGDTSNRDRVGGVCCHAKNGSDVQSNRRRPQTDPDLVSVLHRSALDANIVVSLIVG